MNDIVRRRRMVLNRQFFIHADPEYRGTFVNLFFFFSFLQTKNVACLGKCSVNN